MLGASFLPAGLRSSVGLSHTSKPAWFHRHITPLLQQVSRRACTHPLRTIVAVALLASTTYISLLESSLFDQIGVRDASVGGADFETLLAGSKRLVLGPETNWKWQAVAQHSAGQPGRAVSPELRALCGFGAEIIDRPPKNSLY